MNNTVKTIMAISLTTIVIFAINFEMLNFENYTFLAGVLFAGILASTVLWIDLSIRFIKLCKQHLVLAFLSTTGVIAFTATAFGPHVQKALGNFSNKVPTSQDILVIIVSILAIVGMSTLLLLVLRGTKKDGELGDSRSKGKNVFDLPPRNCQQKAQKKAQ